MPQFRYLVHFSYLGARYSGVAAQKNQANVDTVYSVLSRAFDSLKAKPKISTPLSISSRTDAGVHAFHNTAHIDMDFQPDLALYKYPFDKKADEAHCFNITKELHRFLIDDHQHIRFAL